MLCGGLSGFTSMIAHAGAPPFQIYVLPQRLERDIFVGTSVIFFAAVNWMKLWPFVALGQMTRESILTSLSLFPLALVSTWGGVLLVRRFSAERLARALYSMLLLIGMKLIWDGISGLTAGDIAWQMGTSIIDVPGGLSYCSVKGWFPGRAQPVGIYTTLSG